ncbi:MAG TPA: tetratricopeptide repeat-containing glycosyltransferase family protein [Acetobacteraceae bacterium]|nr:tetratricopeptide repeat-containing glycosyltransferase family protein [Acetobacteraceae bacterium]
MEPGPAPEDAPTPELLLARADRLRDSRRWEQAAELYAQYAEARPQDAPNLIQLGHCRRQLGDLEGALATYRRAERIAPEDWDAPFQVGHVAQLLGRGLEAAESFSRAAMLSPGNIQLRRQLWRSRHRLPPPPPRRAPAAGGPQLAFDITDLVDYLQASRVPTGIQRVQIGILGAVFDRADPPAEILLAAYDAVTFRWWHPEEGAFRRVVELSKIGAREDDPAWRSAVAALAAPDTRPEAPLRDGCVLTTLGNAWGIEDYFRGLRMLRARIRLRYVAFLHDCVPLVMPEHCLDLTTRLYARWFACLPHHADALLSNSAATAADAARFLAPLVPPSWPTCPSPVPLGAEAALMPPGAEAAADALREPRPGEPFVLFVATIESRKNHLLVFQAWLALIRRLGAAAVPRLVCVGRPGWRAEPAMALLRQSPELRRKVSVLSGVSDLALAALYGRCLFTVYNSFHEGWGLPVSESLAQGRLAVVPRHSGLLESGAPGAVFVEPQSEPDLVATLERLILEPAHRAALQARIDRHAATRDWERVAEEVLAQLLRLPDAPPPRPRLGPGQHLSLAWHGEAEPTAAMGMAERVREGLGWWAQQDWGCWTRDGVARLVLPMDMPVGTRVRVYLDLRGPPAPLGLLLRCRGVATRTPWRRLDLSAGQQVTCILEGEVGPAGVEVDLDSGDGALERPPGDPMQRIVGVGVRGVMVCAEGDVAARIGALERAEAG